MGPIRRRSFHVLVCYLAFLFLLALLIGCGSGGASPANPTNPNPSQNPQLPTVSITSDKSTITAGESATLTWTSSQATSVSIDNGIGTVSPSGSQQVQPTKDTTYTITATNAQGSTTAAITIKVSDTRSPVKHLIVVIMQNRSFDHLFGKFPGTDVATASSPGFVQVDAAGKSVSPHTLPLLTGTSLDHSHNAFVRMVDGGKMDQFALVNGDVAMGFYDNNTPGVADLWSLAQQFALADRFFASVLGDAPTNQLYMAAATDNNFAFGVEPKFGPCNVADPAATPFTFPNVGDQLSAKNVGWIWFAEQYGNCTSYNPNHNPFQYFTSTHGTDHIQEFAQFTTKLANGTLPAVSFIQPTNPHAGHPSSDTTISDSSQWLLNLVQQIQNSSTWPDTAVIIIWDSSGGWYDHVPPPTVDNQGFGPRVPLLLISPLSKRNYISHVQMDEVSILKFIQWNWGLASLNPRNDSPASGDLRDMFAF